MPKFLTQDECYRLIQRELPPDAYPDGEHTRYWSTADSWASAGVFADAYTNMSRIYDNQFPQTADERIADHEIKTFGQRSSGGLTLLARQQRILGKLRSVPSMSNPGLTSLVKAELPEGTVVQLVGWNGDTGGDSGSWILDVSELGFNTFLGAYGPFVVTGEGACDANPADFGMSPTDWAEYQAQAYTYECRIYDYTPTAEELAAVDRVLTESEPARSTHIIVLARTVMARMSDLATTSLHLEADIWDGGATWRDSSGAGNNAVRVSTPTIEDSVNFYQRKVVRGGSAKGFHAPNDDFNASTKRTYEILLDDFGTTAQQYFIGRHEGSFVQFAPWLFKNTSSLLQSFVLDNTHTHPWIGSDSYSFSSSLNGKAVIAHVVIDAVARTMDVYLNGVQIVQNNNFLFGTLATPTGLSLGILGAWNNAGSFQPEYFNGTMLELLRHEEVLDQATITARAAEFNRLKGY